MTDGYRTGSPARATASNGLPQGPRVRRPGWRGWFTYAPDGSLVPDGHVEPVDPNERRPVTPAPVAAPRETCRYGTHGPEDQYRNAHGWVECRGCVRENAKRWRKRKKVA